jgi:hypothetical protein
MPLVEARRQASWLALSLGISRTSRTVALLAVVASIYLASIAIAVASTSIIAATTTRAAADPTSPVMHAYTPSTFTPSTFAALAIIALASGAGAACISTRAILHADIAASDDPRDMPRRGPAAARVLVGAISGAMLVIISLAWLGSSGAIGVLAIGVAGIATARNA